MMNISPYSPLFTQWIAMDRNRLIYDGDGVWVITNNETHYWLLQTDGLYLLTTSDRNGPREFMMEAVDVTDIEKYLTCLFGFSIRSSRKLPAIYVPLRAEDLKPGWDMKHIPSKQLAICEDSRLVDSSHFAVHSNLPSSWSAITPPEDYWLLRDPIGRERAVFYNEHAVRFSWIADASLEDLQASYLCPDGLPLFPNGWTGTPGRQPDYAVRAWDHYYENHPRPTQVSDSSTSERQEHGS